MSDNWIWDKSTSTINWIDLEQGVWMYICRTIQSNCPIGFVYGMPLGKTFFIMGMYTPRFARRQGIATHLVDHLSQAFPTMTTQQGSEDGGKEFLLKYGFRHDDRAGWIFQRARGKAVEVVGTLAKGFNFYG